MHSESLSSVYDAIAGGNGGGGNGGGRSVFDGAGDASGGGARGAAMWCVDFRLIKLF
jgi:hypothetical protein